MFKITQQAANKFTLTRYRRDDLLKTDIDLWTIENVTAKELSRLMQGRSNQELSASFKPATLAKPAFVKVIKEPKYWN